MAVSAKMYGSSVVSAIGGGTAYKVMLCTSSYTPNQDTHAAKTDVTSEVTGTGYTAGGVALASVTKTYDAASNTYKFDAADSSWATSTITARYAVVYCTDNNALVAYVDFGADVSSSAGTFSITWDAAGIATVTVA